MVWKNSTFFNENLNISSQSEADIQSPILVSKEQGYKYNTSYDRLIHQYGFQDDFI